MPAILVENVTKRYATERPAPSSEALLGVTLAIQNGDFVALTGRSGSGKTTLLNLIGALDRPTSGRIRVGDLELSSCTDDGLSNYRRTSIGFVFQSFFLSPYRTALENVLLALSFGSAPVSRERDRATEALGSVGLGAYLHAPATELSGGQRQRVALARALVVRPALLLADEPVGNLDTGTRDEILTLLLDYRNKHSATLVIATHEDSIRTVANRVIELSHGQCA